MTQADFVIRECEDCHEEMMDKDRRRRCKSCRKLVCAWCWGHIHGFTSHGIVRGFLMHPMGLARGTKGKASD